MVIQSDDDWHDRSIKIHRNDNRVQRAEDQIKDIQQSVQMDGGDNKRGNIRQVKDLLKRLPNWSITRDK